jgi:hypothetical protein
MRPVKRTGGVVKLWSNTGQTPVERRDAGELSGEMGNPPQDMRVMHTRGKHAYPKYRGFGFGGEVSQMVCVWPVFDQCLTSVLTIV